MPQQHRHFVLAELFQQALIALQCTRHNRLMGDQPGPSWRMAFFAAGLPGIALAAVLWLTVSEPKRGAMAETFTPEPIGPTVGFLASQRSFVIVLIGFCLTTYTNYASAAWIPPFLARVHHLSSAEIGTYAGTFKGLFGMAGTLVGGLMVAQISRRDDRWKLWAPAITSGLAGPVFAVCMLTSDFATMVAALALTSFLVGFRLGPIFAIAQTVARPSSGRWPPRSFC